MIEIERKMIVNKPVKDVWKALFTGFTDVGLWITGVYKSRSMSQKVFYILFFLLSFLKRW